MRRISMATRDELVRAVSERYGGASREERGRILDEFAAVTGLHRKHAVRLLRGGAPGRRCGPGPGRRVYDVAVRQALIVVWEASDRVCGKRLRPLVPLLIDAMERHGHLQLAPEVRGRLLAMSAATIDRALREVRGQAGKGRRRASPSAGVRRSVPVRTFADWDDPAPGFMEADLVAHSGPTAEGSFVQTLTLTDIATGWTELAQFLLGLRTSWQESEVRPTAKPKKRVAQYCRRVPDPFEAVAARVRGWFGAEPWRTARELLERLQGEHPGVYPDGQLRTLQRRLKGWRREVAHTLVFGPTVAGEEAPASPSTPLQSVIAVGAPIAERPPHRSVRADCPHTALTSGV